MKRLFSGTVLALTSLMIAAGPSPMLWNVDVPHAGIDFSVKHFFTPIHGEFDEYDIELLFHRKKIRRTPPCGCRSTSRA